MRELNVYHHELRPNEYAEFYLKYEADRYFFRERRERCEAKWLYLRENFWRCEKDGASAKADWYNKWMDIFEKLAEHYRRLENG